jgi:hypothetical protein
VCKKCSGGDSASLFSMALSSMCLEITLSYLQNYSLKLYLFKFLNKLKKSQEKLQVGFPSPIPLVRPDCYWRKNRTRRVLLGCGPIGRTPGCYPGGCWFESSCPSHSPHLRTREGPTIQRLPPEPEEQVGPFGWGPASFRCDVRVRCRTSASHIHMGDEKWLGREWINGFTGNANKVIAKHIKNIPR